MKKSVKKDPIDLVTSKFRPLKILQHYAGFVIAQGIWEKNHMAIACRWHDDKDIGYPNGFGHEQWFLLPCELKSIDKDMSKINYGQYKETLTLEFDSYVDSEYIIPHDTMVKELIQFGLDNKRLYRKSKGLIAFRNLNLAEILFFNPYPLDMCEEDIEAARLNIPAGSFVPVREVFFYSGIEDMPECISSMYYNYIYVEHFIEVSVYERLGFNLSDIPA